MLGGFGPGYHWLSILELSYSRSTGTRVGQFIRQEAD